MSKLYLVGHDDGTIGIGKGKPTPPPSPAPEEGISRRELVGFIAYLRGKDRVEVEERTLISRTFFNTYSYSVRAMALDALKTVKNAESAEAAYCMLAAQIGKGNSRWQIFPESVSFMKEDLVEYLMTLGFGSDEAAEVTACYGNRTFKRSKWEKDQRLSCEFKLWAAASGGPLRERAYLPNLFRYEYLLFVNRNGITPDTTFSVSEHSVRGAYNAYGYLTSRLFGQSGDGLILGYRDNYHSIRDREKLITLSELILKETGMPEIWLRNMAEDRLLVIRQTKDGEAEPAPEDGMPDGFDRVGWAGDFAVGVFHSDTGAPHFHLADCKTGRKMAVSLTEPVYFRHNPGETDSLSDGEASSLAGWLQESVPELAEIGCSVTNYRYLCVLWNRCNPGKIQPLACPDYATLAKAEPTNC